jgi:hypothetical protein
MGNDAMNELSAIAQDATTHLAQVLLTPQQAWQWLAMVVAIGASLAASPYSAARSASASDSACSALLPTSSAASSWLPTGRYARAMSSQSTIDSGWCASYAPATSWCATAMVSIR